MTPEIVTERLTKLLRKLALPKPVTVDDIKDIIWNAKKSSGSSQLFSMLAPHAKDQETVQEVMKLMQDSWNYFPHGELGGKSPADLVKEYQETGKVDQSKQIPLSKKGKSLHEVFENQYPKTVVFEKLSEDTWGFGFPKLYHDLTEQLWDLEESRVSINVFEKELHRLLKLMPELFDAVNDLAQLYGKNNEPGIAKTLYEQAIANARRYIPKAFIKGEDRAIWAYLENRPFLRMLAGYAMLVEQYEGIGKAIPLYEEILSFNPNDNQGIRALLATAYLKINQPEKVIELTSHYPEDGMSETIMGTLLALLMLKNNARAKKFLEQIKEYKTNIIKELLKEFHPRPAAFKEDMIALGSPDEAYYYWQHQGKLWEQIPGAMDFLRKNTKDIQTHIISLTDKDVLAVDFFHDFLAFLNRLKIRPIKRTATGNMSLKDIEPLLQTLKTVKPVLDHAKKMGWKARTEHEILSLNLIKIITDIMHLTYKKHDKLFLSKNGKAFLDDLSPIDQFSQLFQYYRQRVNWAYYTSFTEKQEALANKLQALQDYIWKMIKEKGDGWIEYKSFCRTLRDEFQLQPLLEASYSNPDDILYRRIDGILFSRILVLFNCVELETKQIDKWNTVIIRFRLTKIGRAMLQEF
jgi:tetratricopeptide (TPR) repeat protein